MIIHIYKCLLDTNTIFLGSQILLDTNTIFFFRVRVSIQTRFFCKITDPIGFYSIRSGQVPDTRLQNAYP